MRYAVEIDSGVLIYISSFIKIGSGNQKVDIGGICSHTDRMEIT
jgi:hypothetical protein